MTVRRYLVSSSALEREGADTASLQTVSFALSEDGSVVLFSGERAVLRTNDFESMLRSLRLSTDDLERESDAPPEG